MATGEAAAFPPPLPHRPIAEVVEGAVWHVTGGYEGDIMGTTWKFGRSMTVLRSGGELTLCNVIRLFPEGEAALEALGTVAHIVRLGSMHSRDYAYYQHRYPAAATWGVDGMPPVEGWAVQHALSPSSCPLPGADVFLFDSKLPEALIVWPLHKALVPCDSFQNWAGPDEFCDERTTKLLQESGFFVPYNVGPMWVRLCEGKRSCFETVLTMDWDAVLPAHGEPVTSGAKALYGASVERVFAQLEAEAAAGAATASAADAEAKDEAAC